MVECYRSLQAPANQQRLPMLTAWLHAGKSSLLNRLTSADILAEDQLFATLDPTTRRLETPGSTEVTPFVYAASWQRLPADVLMCWIDSRGRANGPCSLRDSSCHVQSAACRSLQQLAGAC